jgi:hypothetical protein
MRRISLVVVLSISLAAGAVAGDVMDRDLCIMGRDLAKRSFTAPNLSFDLYAGGIIDVGSLIEGVNLTNGESAESIYAKVDAQRQRLYPDEEIILSITIPEPMMIAESLRHWSRPSTGGTMPTLRTTPGGLNIIARWRRCA